MTPAISVLVPTHERRDALARLLETLAGQTLGPDRFEVVVVVDGSTDGTLELLDGYDAPYSLRSLEQPHRGRAGAINAGVNVAGGDVVVLLDDDLVPAADFLAAHLRAHETGRRLGAVGAVRFELDAAAAPFARHWGGNFEHFLAQIRARPHRTMSWWETYTGAFSVRRDDLLAVGAFDERFDGYGLEDFDLALRLDRSGVELELLPGAVAYHDFDRTFAQAARNAESRGRSAVLFCRLHPEVDVARFGPRDVAPPSLQRRLYRALPRLDPALPFLPGLVERVVSAAERRRSRRLGLVYTLGLEYFFLLGVARASRDNKPTARVGRS